MKTGVRLIPACRERDNAKKPSPARISIGNESFRARCDAQCSKDAPRFSQQICLVKNNFVRLLKQDNTKNCISSDKDYVK